MRNGTEARPRVAVRLFRVLLHLLFVLLVDAEASSHRRKSFAFQRLAECDSDLSTDQATRLLPHTRSGKLAVVLTGSQHSSSLKTPSQQANLLDIRGGSTVCRGVLRTAASKIIRSKTLCWLTLLVSILGESLATSLNKYSRETGSSLAFLGSCFLFLVTYV